MATTISPACRSSQGDQLVGILTNRDIRFAGRPRHGRPGQRLDDRTRRWSPRRWAPRWNRPRHARRHKIEKLPVVDDNGLLSGLITVKDIQKKRQYPQRHL